MRKNTSFVSMEMLFVDKDAIDIKDIHEQSHECNDETTYEMKTNMGNPITLSKALHIIFIYPTCPVFMERQAPPQMQYKIHAKINAECNTKELFQKSLTKFGFNRACTTMIPAQFSIGSDAKKAMEQVRTTVRTTALSINWFS